MRYIKYSFFALCVAMAAMVSNLAAQDVSNNRIGTSAASELLIPVGARDLAMGGATIATSTGIDALHWNPAGLGRLSGSVEGLFSSMAYIADIRVNYGAVGINFSGFGTIAFSIKAMDFGEIPLTSTDDPEGLIGRTFTPSFINVGLSYARAFTDAITAGLSFKIISEDLYRVNGTGFALDVGVQYQDVAGMNGLNLGVALKNIGPQVSFDGPALLRLADPDDARRPTQFLKVNAASWELPSSVELGLAWTRNLNESVGYTVNGAYSNANLALNGWKFGGELKYNMASSLALAGRGGIEVQDLGADDENVFGPTFGFGLTYITPGVDITVDYAYRSVDFFENNNMFSLKLGF